MAVVVRRATQTHNKASPAINIRPDFQSLNALMLVVARQQNQRGLYWLLFLFGVGSDQV